VMNQVYDMDLSVFDPTFLEKSFERRYIASGIDDPEQYYNCLVNNCVEAEAFYRSLHINYSCFFRDSMTFAVLEHRLFPDILSGRPEGSEIRIWSAGCANGQEAYSIGILLSERIEVICSNLLFYYTPDLQKNIIKKLLGAVSDSGYLVTGDIEKSVFINELEIHRISTPAAVFQNSRRRLIV